MAQWISKEGSAANMEFREIIGRRDRAGKEELAKKDFGFFQKRALTRPCTCEKDKLLYKQLVGTVQYHDINETPLNRNSRGRLGEYFYKLVNNKFMDRHATLLMIGESGSGTDKNI